MLLMREVRRWIPGLSFLRVAAGVKVDGLFLKIERFGLFYIQDAEAGLLADVAFQGIGIFYRNEAENIFWGDF